MNYKKIILFLSALLVCVTACLSEEAAEQAPDISMSELRQVIKVGQVVLLDCNGTPSYIKRHIPGAIDFEAAKNDLDKLLPEDKTTLVIAYCGGPRCLAYQAGLKTVSELGYTNLKYFSAGISGWIQAGGQVEAPGLPL